MLLQPIFCNFETKHISVSSLKFTHNDILSSMENSTENVNQLHSMENNKYYYTILYECSPDITTETRHMKDTG